MTKANDRHKECGDAHAQGAYLGVGKTLKAALHQNEARAPDDGQTDE